MRFVTLKWKLKVADKTYEAGLEVRLATLAEARLVFPNIKANPDSVQVAVWLPDFKHPTILHTSQICQKA